MHSISSKVVIVSLIVGAFTLALYYLFRTYPVEHSNWPRIATVISTLAGISIAGIASGLILGLYQRTTGPKRRAVLGALVIAVLGIHGLLSGNQRSAQQTAKLSGQYDFTEDWMSYHVPNWERILAPFKGKPSVRALEIGSFEGRSAIWFLENILTDARASITCIDIFDDATIESRYDKNIAASGVANKVKKIKASSQIALREMQLGAYDFIYIDGSHIAKDVLIDAVLSWELLKPDGVVIFDDYGWAPRSRHRRPDTAVNSFMVIYEPYAELLYRGPAQIAFRKKKAVDLDDVGLMGRISQKLQALF
jgi:Methyltransferase domain